MHSGLGLWGGLGDLAQALITCLVFMQNLMLVALLKIHCESLGCVCEWNINWESQLNSVKNSGPLACAGGLSILTFAELCLKLWQ